MPDSYDLLAESIERVIRSDLRPTSVEQLAGSIDRTMSEEARAGALRLAWLRVLLVTPVVALSLASLGRRDGAWPVASRLLPAIVSLSWLLAAGVLVLVLRAGWYRRWLPHLMPGLDAVAICAVFVVPSYLGTGAGRTMSADALACLVGLSGFLSVSGALQLSRSSSRSGTALAVVVFLLAAFTTRLDPLATLTIATMLVGTGLLSASAATMIRRLVTDEVAKSTLSHMYQEAAQTIDAREQVLKIVSHDLRNPLHTIAMCADVMLDVALPAEKQTENLRRIKRAGERMNRLVQDLLDVAKLEAGRVAINARPLDVAPLLREAHEMLLPLAAEKAIALDLDVADALPQVTADAGRVLQVFSNL
ncbi:MAG TPA: HAMP domain-containing sensor histidine kinase, partial [Gemmatimonadaceae bacterium]|nr:HAMP domain-containing sensor histidine kinase [Gemmatimonadaceae bacterium]